jgi:hypothetical protein
MLTSFLFLIAGLTVITFILVKIFNPENEKKLSTADLLKRIDPEKEFNTGSFLLKLGPVITGLGLIGWIATEWWEYQEIRFLILLISTLLLYGAAAFLYKFAKGNQSFLVLSEGSLLIASFFLLSTLYSGNNLLIANSFAFNIGISELFGLWFIINLGIAYIFKSSWTLGINLMATIFWLSPYLNPNFNFAPILGINNIDNFGNPYSSLLIPVIAVVANCLLYAWHQKKEHHLPSSGYRIFYYLTGLFTFLVSGALIFHSIDIYDEQFKNLNLQGHILHDALFAAITLIIFSIDFVLKKSVKDYNVNYLAAGVFIFTSILGLIIFPSSIFTGFFFIEAAFVIWLLADYLRQKSHITGPIFYAFNGIQLFALATNNDDFNWFKIIIILSILIYASLVNYLNKPFQYYVIVAGTLTLTIKIIATEANPFLMIVAIGFILSIFGVFYTQNRNKILKDRQKHNIDSSKEDKKEDKKINTKQ